jgi:hypothetical protein
MLDDLLAHLRRTACRDLVIQMAGSLDPEQHLPDAGYRQAQGDPADLDRAPFATNAAWTLGLP